MADMTVADLRPDPNNPRKISETARLRLGDLMEEFGDLSGIVRNVVTNELVGGHQRRTHLPSDAVVTITERFDPPTDKGTVAVGFVEVGGERWAYREVAWERAKQVAANIAANNPSVQGEFDFPLLADALTFLEGDGYDSSLSGFDAKQIESMMTWTPSPDALEHKHGEFQDSDLWPEVRLRVPPDTKALFDRVMAGADGETEAARFASVLERVA